MQKKLDERSLKNEKYYKNLTKQVKEVSKKLDISELQKKHQELADMMGSCPLSCNDLFEALQAGDSMCIGLDVARSEACIADPSRLVIKDIIPTFMTADSFLDSAVFSLRKDSGAHGGFMKGTEKSGQLAMGLGREAITGVLPLYLFKEHWDIARRKAPPIYGFLCTLDIMGYASSQYFTIPYLVLLKAIEKAKDGSQIFMKIKEMVLDTCKEIMFFNEEFRKNTIKAIVDFHNSAEFRTADIVPSIRVFLAQLYTLLKLDNYQELYMGEFKLDQKALQVIFRYALEEQMRRSLTHDAEPLSKNQILKVLFPDYAVEVQKVMEIRAREIESQYKQSGTDDEEDVMSRFKHMADQLKDMDESMKIKANPTPGIIEESKVEESKHEEVPAQKKSAESGAQPSKSEQEGIVATTLRKILDSKPWIKLLDDEQTQFAQMAKNAPNVFKKNLKVYLDMATELGISSSPITDFYALPLINGDKQLVCAIALQNLMHPKNHHRREAVTAKQYHALLNLEEAQNYLGNMLIQNLRMEMAGKESAIREDYIKQNAANSGSLFLGAPDIYYSAAVLIQEGLKIGDGGRTSLIYLMMKQAKKCKSIIGKLQIIQKTTFHGHKVIHDKFKNQPDSLVIGRKLIFQMWLTFVRQKRVLTSVDYIQAFPHLAERINLWEECIDETGQFNLDLDKMWEHIKKRAKERRLAKQLAQAQKKKQGRF